MPTRRHYADNAPQLTLQSAITSTATSCTVTPSPTGWPTQFPFSATLEIGTANVEDVLVTNVVGAAFTITRAQNGSTAVAHGAGATIDHTFTMTDADDANAHVTSPSGVHGVAGNVVGTTDVQTLTNKTISGATYTGTQAMASATMSGTLNVTGTTTLGVVNTGAATCTSLSASGAISGASLTITGTGTFSGQLNANAAGTGLAVAHNATVGGTLAVTGAASAASVAATGDVSGKTVTGAHVPTSFTNEAAASTALGSPGTGTIVYLTAPTGGHAAGHYTWDGSAWQFYGRLGRVTAVSYNTDVASSLATEVMGYQTALSVIANKTYRVYVNCEVNGAANSRNTLTLRTDTSTVTNTSTLIGSKQSVTIVISGSAGRQSYTWFAEFTATTTGSLNIAVGVGGVAGGNCTLVGSEFPTQISVDAVA